MTVAELRRRMPASELVEWAGYLAWEGAEKQRAMDRAQRRGKRSPGKGPR